MHLSELFIINPEGTQSVYVDSRDKTNFDKIKNWRSIHKYTPTDF